MSVGSSPTRRHNNARAVQRRWDDWRSEWPLNFIILPVLVAFAFCLVLFLGSKHGTRLAAIKTWFPHRQSCETIDCVKAVTVDSQGGIVSHVAASGAGAQAISTSGGIQTALSGISGLLGLETTRVQPPPPVVLNDLGLMTLDADDQAKFDFARWLAEAEKLVGQQSRDCDTGYGQPYIDQWRKARVDQWCSPEPGGAATTTTTNTAAAGQKSTSASSSAASASSSPAASGTTATGDGKGTAATTGGGGGGSSSGGAFNGRLNGRLLAQSQAKSPQNLITATTVTTSSSQSSGGAGSSGTGGGAAGVKNGTAAGDGKGGGGGKGSSGTSGTAKQGAASAPPAAAGARVESSIALYPFHDKEAYLMFAAAKNTVVDTKTFLGGLSGALPDARPGSYRAACKVDPSKTPAPSTYLAKADAARRWVVDALKGQEYANVSAACAAPSNASTAQPRTQGPVLHPVMLLTRMDPTNAFRTVEEAVTTFLTLAVLNDPQIAKKGLQVAIADGKPDGFFLDLWARLSHPYPLRLLSQTPWAPNTCLTQVVHNGFSGSSIITSMGVAKRTYCRSTVMVAAALWLRHILAPAIQTTARSSFSSVQNKGVVRKTVVWVSRRNFEGLAQANLTPWQDQRRFSNEGEVVLELQREVWRWNDEACIRSGLPKSFGSGRRRQRQLRRLQAALRGGSMGATTAGAATATSALYQEQEDEVAAWQVAEDIVVDIERRQQYQGQQDQGQQEQQGQGQPGPRRGLLGSSGPRCRQSNVFFDLRVIELNDLPFYPDNIQILGQASILAGAHGTGLANMIWMPPARSGVLELHHNSAGNDHYHNMAHMLGHKYVNVESDGDRVELPAAAEGLRKLLDMLGSG